jgi:hypothetical protein
MPTKIAWLLVVVFVVGEACLWFMPAGPAFDRLVVVFGFFQTAAGVAVTYLFALPALKFWKTIR